MAQQGCPICGTVPSNPVGGEPFWCSTCKRIVSPSDASPTSSTAESSTHTGDFSDSVEDPVWEMEEAEEPGHEKDVQGGGENERAGKAPAESEGSVEIPRADTENNALLDSLPSIEDLMDDSEFTFLGDNAQAAAGQDFQGIEPDMTPQAEEGLYENANPAKSESSSARTDTPELESGAYGLEEGSSGLETEEEHGSDAEELSPEFAQFAAYASQVEQALAEVQSSLSELEGITQSIESEREVLREDLRILRSEIDALPNRMTAEEQKTSGEQTLGTGDETQQKQGEASDEVDPGLSAMIESFMRFTGRE